MSARLNMTMRCTIQRNGAATDDWGQPGAPGWADTLADQPCFAWVQKGTEVMDNKVVVIHDLHVLLPLDTDVTEADQIVEVTDRQGDLKFPGPMQIRSVDRMKTFLDVSVVTAR